MAPQQIVDVGTASRKGHGRTTRSKEIVDGSPARQTEVVELALDFIFDILSCYQRVPGASHGVDIEIPVAELAVDRQLQVIIVTVLLTQRGDIEFDRPGSRGARVDDSNVIRIDFPDNDIKHTVIVIGIRPRGGRWGKNKPVRVPGGRLLEADVGLIEPDQFDGQRRTEHRERVDPQLDISEVEHVSGLRPVGILEANSFRDDDRLSPEVDVEAALDDEFATGFLGYPALQLRLDHAEIAKPQPQEQGNQQECKAAGRPESNSSETHRASAAYLVRILDIAVPY